MFKSTLFTTLFLFVALLISTASAAPPACVLACVNEQPTPSAYADVCSSADVQSCLSSKCGDSKQAALDFFKSTCAADGHSVATAVISSSSSKSAASSGFTTSTSTGADTNPTAATNASSTSSGPTPTGSAAQSGNPNAASNVAIGSTIGVVALAVSLLLL